MVVHWFSWKERNKFIHGERLRPLEEILANAGFWLYEFQEASSCMKIKCLDHVPKVERWHPLDLRLQKMNVDAEVSEETCRVGVDVVVCDAEGQVLSAIAEIVHGNFDPYVAECIALRQGLLFAKDTGLQVIYVETDSLNVVRAFGRDDMLAEEGLILNDVRLLLEEVSKGTCRRISRAGNKAAHSLTKFALSSFCSGYWLEEITDWISHIITSDLLVNN